MWIRPALLMLVIGLCICTQGCRSRAVAQENDRLREENHALQIEVEALTRRNTELERELRDAAALPDSLPEIARAAVPHVVAISIGRLSHFRDADRDGVIETLTIYVTPADGRGRFVQLVGELAANAAVLPAESDAITLGRMTMDALAVREAYRAGITGTHYTIDLPVRVEGASASSSGDERALVRVIYTDARTGESVSAERAVPLP